MEIYMVHKYWIGWGGERAKEKVLQKDIKANVY